MENAEFQGNVSVTDSSLAFDTFIAYTMAHSPF